MKTSFVLLLACAACSSIDISGIDRTVVFAKLYESAQSSMSSFFRKKMAPKDAIKHIGKYVDEIDGVTMNVCVPGKDEESRLDARRYNEANGEGLAEKVIEKLRRKIGEGDAYGSTEPCEETRGNPNCQSCDQYCTPDRKRHCAVCTAACCTCACCVVSCVSNAAIPVACCAGFGACAGALVGVVSASGGAVSIPIATAAGAATCAGVGAIVSCCCHGPKELYYQSRQRFEYMV